MQPSPACATLPANGSPVCLGSHATTPRQEERLYRWMTVVAILAVIGSVWLF
jgi:hypothetical protein